MTLLGIWKPYFTQRFFITLNINILCKLQHSEWCGSLVFLLFLIKDLNFKPKRRLPCFSSITRFSRRPHSLEWKSSCIACSQCWISSDTRGGCRDLPHVSYENDGRGPEDAQRNGCPKILLHSVTPVLGGRSQIWVHFACSGLSRS